MTDVSQVLVLGAAGLIYYMASKKRSRLQASMDKPRDRKREDPTQERYEDAKSNNRYLIDLMQSGFQPRTTLGCMGVPMSLYPKPGGKGYWVVRNPHTMVN